MTIGAQPMMGSYERRVLELLRDGRPHSEVELRTVCHYPREWVKALREDGFEVAELDGKYQLVDVA